MYVGKCIHILVIAAVHWPSYADTRDNEMIGPSVKKREDEKDANTISA